LGIIIKTNLDNLQKLGFDNWFKDKVEIRISDNGNGIPSDILDKIFQPFLQQNRLEKEPVWGYL